jgi:hypothetical protein
MEAEGAEELDDVPLFATHVPAAGLSAGMMAIAALIDEDEPEQSSRRACGKRKAVSMGEVQVSLALASTSPSSCDVSEDRPSQRRRTTSEAPETRELGIIAQTFDDGPTTRPRTVDPCGGLSVSS